MSEEDQIVSRVARCLNDLCNEFVKYSGLYYNEHDLASELYSRIRDQLSNFGAKDRCREMHRLVHREYPTYFRWIVNGRESRVGSDTDKNRRGRCDLVVLNPKLMRDHSFEEINGQTFRKCKQTVISWSKKNGPAILYGVELKYKRKKMGENAKGTADNNVRDVVQDHLKLVESIKNGFLARAESAFFIRATNSAIVDYIRQELSEFPNIRVVAAYPPNRS